MIVATAPASAHVVAPSDGGPQLVGAHSEPSAAQQRVTLTTACTGTSPNQGSVPMPSPDQVITGEFGPAFQGSYVMVPFSVPAGTDAVRVKYCHDQPALLDPQGLNHHTIDLGLYEPDENANGVPDEPEFRGWGGSSRKDVTLSPEGTIDPDPDVATQKTTVGYLPGPIPAGEWAAELGVAAIGQELATEDGVVQWRLEIDYIDDPAFSDEPYSAVPYDTTPANAGPGWYAGDLHVHARHSNPSDATMRTTFNYAFCPDPALGALCQEPGAQPGAGLDFITLSDYVTTRHWGEIGAFQPDYPGHLIIRSAEVITYRGHVNNHASVDFADYRTGSILRAHLSGTPSDPAREMTGASELRPARPARPIFDEINSAGGFTQINHPETFPSEIPTFGNLCRGCSWEYSDAETDYSQVDAIEIATGPAGLQQAPTKPGPNPFTPLAIEFYQHGVDADGVNSNHIAAVGSSDSHKAGESSPTSSPIGQATTVVRAGELSEKGIQRGVEAGHTYVKLWGNDGPDLRLEASVPGSGDPPAIMGDTVHADQLSFTAQVLNLNRAFDAREGTYTLFVLRNGLPFLAVPLPPNEYQEDEFSFGFPSVGPSRYQLQVERETTGLASIEAFSSPIYHEPVQGGPPPPAAAITDVSVIEGDSGRRDAKFTVSVSSPRPGPVSVDYATAEGTASAGADFESGAGIVTFQPGETSKQVAVPVIGDVLEEPDETFSVELSNPAGVTIAKPRGAGTILDDEGEQPGRCAQTQRGTENGEQLFGTELSDAILGNGGDDVIAGGPGPDCLDGGAGNDEVDGDGGRDRVRGGEGDDRLRGGKGRDRVRGGRGDDRIRVRGGGRDRVRCGPGKDRVVAGPADKLRGCERIR